MCAHAPILPAIMARRRPRWRAPAEADSHRSQAACSPFRRQTLANSGETAISLIVLCLFAGFRRYCAGPHRGAGGRDPSAPQSGESAALSACIPTVGLDLDSYGSRTGCRLFGPLHSPASLVEICHDFVVRTLA